MYLFIVNLHTLRYEVPVSRVSCHENGVTTEQNRDLKNIYTQHEFVSLYHFHLIYT